MKTRLTILVVLCSILLTLLPTAIQAQAPPCRSSVTVYFTRYDAPATFTHSVVRTSRLDGYTYANEVSKGGMWLGPMLVPAAMILRVDVTPQDNCGG